MAKLDNLSFSAASNSSLIPPSSAHVTESTRAILAPLTTLHPGHAAILEMHANSRSNAIIYIGVVLMLYVLGISVVLIKYFRTERYEARLSRLFQDLMQREHFFPMSRRRSSVPKNTPEPSTCVNEESPTFILQVNGDLEMESKL